MSRIAAVAVLCSLNILAACAEMPAEPVMPAGGPAFVTYAPGEQQPNVDLSRGTWGIFPEKEGQIVAQTFTPVNSGSLGYIQLPVGCAPGVLLNVKVRQGLGGRLMFEGNARGLPEHVDGSFLDIQVHDPLKSDGLELEAGRTYAFELAAIPEADATDRTCGIAKGPAGNSYNGGRSYFKEPRMADFLPLPNGSEKDDEDLPFITLMG